MSSDVNSADPIEGASASGGRSVAAFAAQLDAHAAADYLIFSGIPVDQVEVVGQDVSPAGRSTIPADAARIALKPAWAALVGAFTGAWTGLLLGLIVSFFAALGRDGVDLWPLVVVAMVIGAGVGIFLGLRLARIDAERRELALTLFSADYWIVAVEKKHTETARRLLSERSRTNQR